MIKQYLVFSFILATTLWVGDAQAANRRVLVVSVEQRGILQTGGLAHATTDFVKALNEVGIAADVLMPHYLEMNTPDVLTETDQHYDVALDWRGGQPHKHSRFGLYYLEETFERTYFLKHHVSDETENYFANFTAFGQRPYYGPEATIGEAFGAFSKAAAEFILQNSYDIVILNDWTAGLVAAYLHQAKMQGRKVPKVIFAIHNLAYQGLFPKSLVDFLGLPESYFSIDGYEYHGQVSFLKSGIQYADMIYTVSPQYAKEVTTERFGHGLDGLMRKKSAEGVFVGILNGIDNSNWEPSHPYHQNWPAFSAQDLSGKAKGKKLLQEKVGLPVDERVPLIVLTSRLAEQKGFEYLIEAINRTAHSYHAQFIIIGDGEARYVEQAQMLQHKYPAKIRYLVFSSELEHMLMNYGDFFVNAAWFEPCGLNQFFALRSGTLPIVSRAGGLFDSVKDGETGFLVTIPEGLRGSPYDIDRAVKSVARALAEALDVYNHNPQKILSMRQAAMAEDHSWQHQVHDEFIPLFERLSANPCAAALE